MTTVEIKLNLPDATARAAQAAGLLTPQALEQLLEDALRTQSIKQLDDTLAHLRDDPLPPMSADEIQAEIEAYRAEKRAAARS